MLHRIRDDGQDANAFVPGGVIAFMSSQPRGMDRCSLCLLHSPLTNRKTARVLRTGRFVVVTSARENLEDQRACALQVGDGDVDVVEHHNLMRMTLESFALIRLARLQTHGGGDCFAFSPFVPVRRGPPGPRFKFYLPSTSYQAMPW